MCIYVYNCQKTYLTYSQKYELAKYVPNLYTVIEQKSLNDVL